MEFEFSPSNPRSRPRFIAPHHPRADQAVIYDTMGLNPTSLITGHLSGWDPYAFGSRAPSVGACQYLLHGGKTNLLKCEELRRRSDPPVAMRVSTIMLEPVSLEEHRSKGTWWKRTYVGPHVPTQEKDPHFFEYAIADPELWHFDAIFWRRRSRLRPLMDRALAGDDPMQLATVDGDGIITEADVETFWRDFVPMLAGDVRSTFDTLPDTVEAVRARFDARTERALYRLLQRFSLFLVVRLEPHYLYKWLSPEIPVKTYFHLWMLAQYVVGSGKEAYLAAYREPLSVVRYVPELTTQNGLYAQSIFRFDEMTFEAQKLRLITAYVYPHDQKLKAELAEKTRGWDLSGLKPGERLFINIGRTVSGFFNVLPDIRDGFKGPRFERGSPERYPIFQELPTGEVVVKEYG
jgi:hypothetical protein